jgi:hypothetical protein
MMEKSGFSEGDYGGRTSLTKKLLPIALSPLHHIKYQTDGVPLTWTVTCPRSTSRVQQNDNHTTPPLLAGLKDGSASTAGLFSRIAT